MGPKLRVRNFSLISLKKRFSTYRSWMKVTLFPLNFLTVTLSNGVQMKYSGTSFLLIAAVKFKQKSQNLW